MFMIICGLLAVVVLFWLCWKLHELRQDEAVEIALEDIAG